MQSIKDYVKRLLFHLRWILAHGKIALLYAEDLSIYVCRRHRFHPADHRSLDDISEQDCFTWFSQNHANICRLLLHLRVPVSFMHESNGAVYTGVECFLVWLYHLTKRSPFTKMARFVFGGDPCGLSEMNDLFIAYSYNTFSIRYQGLASTSGCLINWIYVESSYLILLQLVQSRKFSLRMVRWLTDSGSYITLSMTLFVCLVSWMILPFQQHALGIWLLGGRAIMKTFSGLSIQDILVNMTSRCKWFFFQLGWLDPYSSQKFARVTMAYLRWVVSMIFFAGSCQAI